LAFTAGTLNGPRTEQVEAAAWKMGSRVARRI
jgi:hypothetical protein